MENRPRNQFWVVATFAVAVVFASGCATPPTKPAQYDAFQIPEDLPRKPSKDDRFQISNSLIICSWNIKWFGRSSTEKYDFVTMADFVEECDVTAIQEVRDPNQAAVLSALLTELTNRGHSYDHRVSANTGYKNNSIAGRNNYLEAIS